MAATFLANTLARLRALFRDPSRRAKTSSGFGAGALVSLAAGVILFLQLKDRGGAILISSMVVSFSCGLVAVIAGHTARSALRTIGRRLAGLQVRKSAMQIRTERRALAGLALGYFGALSPLFLGLALPVVRQPRTDRNHTANDLEAIESLRTLNAALTSFAQACHHGFAERLTDLGPSTPGSGADCHAAGLINSELASGTKQGYNFIYVVVHLDQAGGVDQYVIRADPAIRGRTGSRSFYTDQTGVIRSNARGIASAHDGPVD